MKRYARHSPFPRMQAVSSSLFVVLVLVLQAWAQEPTSTKVTSFFERLQSESPTVRQDAAETLGAFGDPAAVPALSQTLLHDTDAAVRWTAAEALGSLGDPAAVPALSQTLLHDTDTDVRWTAAMVLRTLRDPAAVPALSQTLLHDTDAAVRRAAAMALMGIGNQAAIPALSQAVQQDTDADVRQAAAMALMGIREPATVPALSQTLLHDTDAAVRRVAAEALGEIGDAAAVPALSQAMQQDTNADVRRMAAKALVGFASGLQDNVQELSDADLQQAIGSLERMLEALHSSVVGFRNQAQTTAALRQSLQALTAARVSRTSVNWADMLTGMRQQPWVWGLAAYVASLSLIWTTLLWRRPLWLLRINDALELPAGFGKTKSLLRYGLLVGFLHYHRRVLDAWVKAHVNTARDVFGGLETVRASAASVPVSLRLDDGATTKEILELRGEDFRGLFQSKAAVLLIRGQGGVGKTSLACQMAHWAFHRDVQRRLCTHLMLPVLLEDEFPGVQERDSNAVLLDVVRRALADLVQAPHDLSAAFVEQLLLQRRLVLIVDSLSEMSQATRGVIAPRRAGFPAKALIVTSRYQEQFGVGMQTVLPQRFTSAHLASFVDAYLKLKQSRHLLDDAAYFELCRHLSALVGERDITVLLARMFLDQVLPLQAGEGLSQRVPRDIPELMVGYLHWLNRPATGEVTPPDVALEAVAKQIAWECVRQEFRPGRANVLALQAALPETTEHLQRLIDLGVVVRSGTAKEYVRFALAPLAEYLAGLEVVERYRDNHEWWWEFLTQANAKSSAPETIEGFLLAVRDCCLATGSAAAVPEFVPVQLAQLTWPVPTGLYPAQHEPHAAHPDVYLAAPEAADGRTPATPSDQPDATVADLTDQPPAQAEDGWQTAEPPGQPDDAVADLADLPPAQDEDSQQMTAEAPNQRESAVPDFADLPPAQAEEDRQSAEPPEQPEGIIPDLAEPLAQNEDSRQTASEPAEPLAPDDQGAIPAIVADLAAALHDQDWEIRHQAAEALERLGSPAVPVLTEGLKNRDEEVCQLSAEALRRIGPPAVPALADLLKEQSWAVRWQAARVLGTIGTPAHAAVPALLEALHDQDKVVRRQAAGALGSIGTAAHAAVPVLLEALHDRDWAVRLWAARALGTIGTAAHAAVPVLLEALHDQDKAVRRQAARALENIRTEAEAEEVQEKN